MNIYSKDELSILREGGKRLAEIREKVAARAVPGVKTKELDAYARELIEEAGDTPAFLNYRPDGADYPYPAALCVSVNDEVVHGIPGERILEDGDIVGLDFGIKHKGFFTDSAITVPVGNISSIARKLIEDTRESLMRGIGAARGGGRIGDIGHAVESFARPLGYGIVEILGGHGVGDRQHEEPYIPNIGRRGTGPKLMSGMVLAIEPMLNLGTEKVMLGKDGYAWRTKDGSLSAHFEHTILVTDSEAEILT
ncbi:type I methionyl aminopeptidase [bacterium]|nr:type I methionyl aminopeptidase [bacterium]